MGPIYKISGDQLNLLKRMLATESIHTLRVCVDDGGVKVKPNQHMWTQALGEEEPPT